jgi:hypothetical protein
VLTACRYAAFGLLILLLIALAVVSTVGSFDDAKQSLSLVTEGNGSVMAAFGLFTLGGLALGPELKRNLPGLVQGTGLQGSSTATDWKAPLLKVLKTYRHELSRGRIEFVSMQYQPRAKEFEAIFKLAGWAVELDTGPQLNRSLKGILVMGFNRVLVDAMAKAIGEEATTEVRPLLWPAENPKSISFVHIVYITVGYATS